MSLLPLKILKDSSSYHLLKEMMGPDIEKEIREEIRVEEARSILVTLATDRFGEPTEAQKAVVDGITDHDRLVRLCMKVASFSPWDELLGSESPF